MKVRILFMSVVLLLVSVFFFAGCGDDSDDAVAETPLLSITYGGADPKGDYIAITVDGTAKTVIYNNYTTSEEHGPYAYTKITNAALNYGFSNMYMTEVFNDIANTYALFVIADGAAIIFQLFNNQGTAADFSDDLPEGTPGYAFSRRDVADLSDYEGTAYNWISFKMDTSATNADSNFEAGFAAFDTDGTGLLYGACYNNRAEVESWIGFTNGIKDINDSGLALDSFAYDSATLGHTSVNFTLIPNENDDFVLDFGQNEGAGFAIHQADTKEWQAAYNGTFFMMSYSNNSAGDSQDVTPMKLVLSSGAGSAGHFQAYDLEGALQAEADMVAFEDFTGNPGGGAVIKDQFATASDCASAASTVVKNAYNAHGGFVATWDSGDAVLFAMMDPAGKYLFFTMFSAEGGGYGYVFGFGVK